MLPTVLAIIIVSAIITEITLAIYVWREHDSPLAIPYSLTMCALAGWTMGYGLSLFGENVHDKQLARQLTYFLTL